MMSRGVPDAAPRQASIPAPAEHPAAPVAPPADRPQMAPQALEMTRFAPEKGAPSEASDEARPGRDRSRGPAGAKRGHQAVAAPIDGPRTAPQAPENIDSAPGNGGTPVAASGDGAEHAPPPANPIERPHRRIGRPEPLGGTRDGRLHGPRRPGRRQTGEFPDSARRRGGLLSRSRSSQPSVRVSKIRSGSI